MVEEARDEISLALIQAFERSLEMLLDDSLGSAELGERRCAQDVRASRAFDLPETLQDELEVRRLDAARRSGSSTSPRPVRCRSILPAATSSNTASTSSSSAVTPTPPSSAYTLSGPSIAARAAARVR